MIRRARPARRGSRSERAAEINGTMYSIRPEQLDDEQQKILRAVALAYRRVITAPYKPGATRADLAAGSETPGRSSRRSDRRVSAAKPFSSRRSARISGEVNRIIAAAINANSEWFWRGPDA